MTPAALLLVVCAQVAGGGAPGVPGGGPGEPPGERAAGAAGGAPGVPEVTLDAVVAVLESEADPVPRFVLRGDFVLLLRAELRMRGAPDALHVEVDPASVSAPILEQLGAEMLAAREAERAAMGDADPADVSSQREYVVARLGGEGGLRELLEATGASMAEFDAMVRRRVVAARYLRSRYPRLVEPTSQDLRARWEDERRRAPDATPDTFAAARPLLVERMVREALPRALRQYLRSLGSRVRVRYPGAPAGAP